MSRTRTTVERMWESETAFDKVTDCGGPWLCTHPVLTYTAPLFLSNLYTQHRTRTHNAEIKNLPLYQQSHPGIPSLAF